jgi:hypothetical protein
MKTILLKSLAFSFLVISVASCKKSDSAPAAKTKTVLLTQNTWKVQTVSVDLNKDGTGDADATSYFQSCDLDNIYTFKTDNTGILDEGAAKCNPDNPQTTGFNWIFKSSETILNGVFTSTTGDATILSINDTNLVVSYDYSTPGGIYRIIATLQH